MKVLVLTAVAFISFFDITARTNAGLLSDVVTVIGSSQGPKPAVCLLCNIGISAFLAVYRNPETSDEEAREVAIGLCLQLKTHSEQLCRGLVDNNLEAMQYILDNRPDLTAQGICSTIFQEDNCGVEDPSLDWSIDLEELSQAALNITTRDVTTPATFDTTTPATEAETTELPKPGPLTIVQLTDIHYDPKYAPGGNAECSEPVCCRNDQGAAKKAEAGAGRWGDYRGCDLPWEAVTNALQHVRRQHKHIDYIYMTGDLVDHGIWDTSITSNNDTFRKVIDEIRDTFPDVPVFPCLGNHEAHPVNVFAPTSVSSPNISSRWLYEATADLWSAWLPAHTWDTILRGGYYTAPVRAGLRVVALNSNQCHVYNWWLLYDARDPDRQLEWLAGVLARAEADGERVHILHHISPGHPDCYKVWSREFSRIISRFANTVTAQVSGHTHFDEFQIFYSVDDPTQAVNVLYNGGSLTTYKDKNPNYKVYTVDDKNFDVVDHETWIYNVTLANLQPDSMPEWYKMYDFREAYKVDSLAPAELDKLAHRIAADRDLLDRHFRYHNLLGDPKLEHGCDKKCGEKLLCAIVTADTSDDTRCRQIVTEHKLAKKIHRGKRP